MTRTFSPLPEGDSPDETRLAPAGGSEHAPTAGSAPGSSPSPAASPSSAASGWLTSSGGIDHGRFPPGTILGGRYRIVGRLGKGGMGEVFRADDLKLGQQVALKFLPPAVDRDPARLTQLHTEVRLARQVSHPNVCRVYDIDEIEGHTFLSMEYVDGEDLSSLLRRIGHFPEARGVEIARQICAGLASAHERGVVHRDFKPANVMLDGTGRVRIADFGLAGAAGEALRAGTPAYMAPEQLAGSEVTARSDIYSLGLVLYEVFTGRRALEGSNLAELIRRREQEEVLPPSALIRDLSPEIDRAVMRCLAADPADRPASALAVSAALPGGDPLAAALAAGETPSPAMVAAAGETADGMRRSAGIGLLSVVIVGMLVIAALSSRTLVVGRVAFEKSPDVLEDRARQILASAGYSDPPADEARGAAIDREYLEWIGRTDQSPARWDALSQGHGPLLRFWYRTSPRELRPPPQAWAPGFNEPPLSLSGMASVIVDERGRLLEFVTVPPQLDTSPPAEAAVDWTPMFEAAGLRLPEFSAATPQWTPRIYAEERVAWEGPMRGFPEATLRVEASSYRGRPASFQLVWPWTRAQRMEAPEVSPLIRALSAAGTMFIILLMTGALALVRYNLRSGRADRRGAARVALFLIGVWIASWALGADHSLVIETEIEMFFSFLAFAFVNVGFTWLFYLALEPFVRRFCPELLITWSRLLAGQVRDQRLGRDVLIGVTLGVFLGLLSVADALLPELLGGAAEQPQASNVQYLFGLHYTIAGVLRVIPNGLQGAMIGTFAYVVLLALFHRRSVAIAAVALMVSAALIFEIGDRRLWPAVVLTALFVVPLLFVFVRYGLVATATAMMIQNMLNIVPLTVDLSRPHAAASTMVILIIGSAAAYAVHISGATAGIFRRLVPST